MTEPGKVKTEKKRKKSEENAVSVCLNFITPNAEYRNIQESTLFTMSAY